MKVRLLPLAISAAIAMPSIALADGPTVYGKFNVAFGTQKYDYGYDAGYTTTKNTADDWTMTSYASRLGVKGSETINEDLSAIYQAEYEIDPTGDGTVFKQRTIFAGLKGGWGAFKAGYMDSPLKSSQGKIDQFNDTSGDLTGIFLGENRTSHTLMYSSPKMSGLQADIAIMPGQQLDSGQPNAKSGPAESASIDVNYTMDNLYVALAHDSKVKSTFNYGVKNTVDAISKSDGYSFNTTRLTGVFTMDALQLGAMYQTASTEDKVSFTDSLGNTYNNIDIDQDGFLLSASYKIGQIKLKGQYGASDTKAKTSPDVKVKNTLAAIGADYDLSKQTSFYVHYTDVAYKLDETGGKDQKKTVLDFGMVHNF